MDASQVVTCKALSLACWRITGEASSIGVPLRFLETKKIKGTMLNEYNNNQSVEIKPACTGMLQKSHPKSYFKWCHVGSDYRKNVVDGNPRVLQVMVFGDNNMMVEMLPQEVYEEWIGKEKEADNGE